MNTLTALAILSIVALGANAQYGIARITATTANPGLSGYVTFSPNAGDSSLVDVSVNVTGITVNPDAQHGIHVHQYGDISTKNGSAVLSHFNPLNSSHGCPPTTTRHFGDMGNWEATGGSIVQTKTGLDLLTLTGANSIIGRAVIVHSNVDDCASTTSSASRLGQGVIGIANVAGNTASSSSNATAAICVLAPISDATIQTIYGYAIMTQSSFESAPLLLVTLTGVDSVVRAIHVHAYGDISTMASHGSHWNASGDNIHGVYGYPHHHTGDLGNVYYFDPSDATGNTAYFYQDSNPSFGLNGAQPNPIGHSLVVHIQRDNCSNPIGNSGSRVASCVWALTDLSYADSLTPVPSAAVPTALDAQTIADCNATFAQTSTSTSAASSTTTGSAASTSSKTTGSASGTTGSSAAFVAFSGLLITVSALFSL